MDALWKAAIALTGIAGLGAFVFYALYKDWMRLPAVSTLSRPQRFSLFRLFLVLVFLFAIASLGISAYSSHLEKAAAQASATELNKLLEDRYQHGLRLIAEFQTSATTPDTKERLVEFRKTYEAQFSAARAALANGEFVRYHELSKRLIQEVEQFDGLTPEQKARIGSEVLGPVDPRTSTG